MQSLENLQIQIEQSQTWLPLAYISHELISKLIKLQNEISTDPWWRDAFEATQNPELFGFNITSSGDILPVFKIDHEPMAEVFYQVKRDETEPRRGYFTPVAFQQAG